MAYNSDGYIMIDFTEVDFRRTNQTIDGLYKRCVDVIGTNKFILVINANGRTPLPATCSFTNNQYVIDTVIYMFAVSSNDNLFIRRNDVPASDIIDDSSVSVDKTWSSNKIDTELDSKQDTLTAGNNISIVDNVISAIGVTVKSFSYRGIGTTTDHRIDIPNDCHVILCIQNRDVISGTYSQFRLLTLLPILKTGSVLGVINRGNLQSTTISQLGIDINYFNGYITTSTQSNASSNLNTLDITYDVYYI